MRGLKVAALGVIFLGALYSLLQPLHYFASKSALPSLSTLGNRIVRDDTKQPVTLRGVTSDYFRYGFNANYPDTYGGLEAELTTLGRLTSLTNINLVMLYLGRLDKTKERVDELDQYIAFATQHGLYVMLAPAGTGFIETNPNKNAQADSAYWAHTGPNDLSELTEFLAARYANYPNVIYQPTAEPNLSDAKWDALQESLAKTIRSHTNNLIVASTPYYNSYITLPILAYPNVAYSVGGYLRKDDRSPVERTVDGILGNLSVQGVYPTIVTEFGGNYGDDFSSSRDLSLFKEMLLKIQVANDSFSVYRLRSAFENDGLALFTTSNELSEKGKVFAEMYRK